MTAAEICTDICLLSAGVQDCASLVDHDSAEVRRRIRSYYDRSKKLDAAVSMLRDPAVREHLAAKLELLSVDLVALRLQSSSG